MTRRLLLLSLLSVLSWSQYTVRCSKLPSRERAQRQAVRAQRKVQVALECCRGEFADNGVCKLCPANTYQPLVNGTSCIPCSNATFPDGEMRPYSWAGNGDKWWCHAKCPPNQYWTYPCVTCDECPCHAPPPVQCSDKVGPSGGCILNPVIEECFERARCGSSPCTFVNTSTGARAITFTDTEQSTNVTFNCSTDITLQVLVVAGGGGGGNGRNLVGAGGGGGGGGVAAGNVTFAGNTTYTVTVGAGGGLDSNGDNTMIMRWSSSETVVLAIGGGGGAGGDGSLAGAGGSGGGGGTSVAVMGGSSTPESSTNSSEFTFLGSQGGNGSTSYCSGAGGGGADRVGNSTFSNDGGGGGQGYLWPVTNMTYGGGGGGGACGSVGNTGATGGAGGEGGGGKGGTFLPGQASAPSAGTESTGGGGGGAIDAGSDDRAFGGSGIVILALT